MNLFKVYPLFDIDPVKGQGAYIYNQAGAKYLDFYTGHAVISIGHAHPHYVKAITDQIQNLGFYSNSVQNQLQIKLVDKLGQVSGMEDYQLFLCNSGAEAIENALKVASYLTGKTKVIAFEKSFHGRTAVAINVTDKMKFKPAINKGYPVEFHTINQITTIEQSLKQGDVCAIILEGVQGIGGIHIPEDDFLQELSMLSRQYKAPLILDEVQSGFGRTGSFFSFQTSGILPDMICMAKGMGNGFPVGGVLFKNWIKAQYGLCGSTFGGNHLACVAVTAVLEVIEQEELISNAAYMGQYLNQELEKLSGLKQIRGKGLMLGLEFEFSVKQLRQQLLYKYKVFTGSSSDPNTLRILPPLTINQTDADLFISKLNQAICQMPQLQAPPYS